MILWQILFWLSCLIVFYNYAGYALIVSLLNRLKKGKRPVFPHSDDQYPSVSFIVAAYNEEDCIDKKVQNSLEQDYPSEKIEFIFITDGSSDGTADAIRAYPRVRVLHQPERRGKSAAINRAVREAGNDILIFSDANTILNTQAVRHIARHYTSPQVGGVAGEKKVLSAGTGTDGVGASEGLYWKYESVLKQLDSNFYSVVGAAGELFSLRKSLFEPVHDSVILDDFIISMKVAEKGFRIVYEPDAYAMELPSFSLQDEKKRKVRIAAGGFQAMGMLSSLLRFWENPRLSFLYISHRVLRWTLSPLSMIMAFVSAGVLALGTGNLFWMAMFGAQVLFYGAALVGSRVTSKQGMAKLFKTVYYFVFMNVSVIQGFFRFLKGRQPATWEKAKRAQPVLQGKETVGQGT